MTHIFGGCLCEKVRYKISSPPISQGICYCLHCQKTGGAFGSPVMVLAKNAFDCDKEALSLFETKSDRGSIVTRNFCRECGSHIFARISDIDTLITVKANTLDDFSHFAPEYLVFTKSAAPSCVFPSGIPSFLESAPPEVVLTGKRTLRGAFNG